MCYRRSHMNKDIYNYKYVTEYKLPIIDRTQFALDFAHAIESKSLLVKKLLGDNLNQVITDVIYYRDTQRRWKNIPQQKHQRLWNAYCITYWPFKELSKVSIDQWGYIKWKDIGYEPAIITSAEDAYALSEQMSSSEPKYDI